MTDDLSLDPDIEAPPRRFKSVEEFTVNEHLERRRTGSVPETDAYRAYRRKVLEQAGVAESTDTAPVDTADMTPEQHAARKYGNA